MGGVRWVLPKPGGLQQLGYVGWWVVVVGGASILVPAVASIWCHHKCLIANPKLFLNIMIKLGCQRPPPWPADIAAGNVNSGSRLTGQAVPAGVRDTRAHATRP